MSLTEEYLKAYDQASQGLTRTGRAILRCSKNETDLGYIETSASDTVELKAGALDDDSLSKWFEEVWAALRFHIDRWLIRNVSIIFTGPA